MKNIHKIRFEIIKNLKKKNIRCFTGACPEIYLEKSFKKLNNLKVKRLENCKILGKTSLALDVNHTLSYSQHETELVRIKQVLNKIFIF